MSNLIECPDCGKEMSDEAVACPNCGKPNQATRREKRGNLQAGGCLLIILGFVLCFLTPVLGGIVGIIGIVILILGFFA